MNIKQIAFGELKHAKGEDAIRIVETGLGIKELTANIEAFGLIQPLLVKPNGKSFIVVDGNRRFAALGLLEKKPATVPCVVDVEAGVEHGLSANTMRQAMNPMDQFDAFSKLVAAGMKPAEIGTAYGRSKKEIEQILVLASLAPAIKDLVRNGKVDMDTAEALTMVSDHKRQQQLLSQNKSGWAIRRAIEERLPDLANALFPKKEYEKAGGKLVVDLFGRVENFGNDNLSGVCQDEEIFWKLQSPFIKKFKDELLADGWGKVLTFSNRDELPKNHHGLPSMSSISKKLRPFHMVHIAVAKDGTVEVQKFAAPDPAKAIELKKAKGDKPTKADEKKAAAAAEEQGDGLSKALSDDLGYHRNMAIKEAIAKDPPGLGAKIALYGLLTRHSIGNLTYSARPVLSAEAKRMKTREIILAEVKALAGIDLTLGTWSEKGLWDKIAKLKSPEILSCFGAIAMEVATLSYGRGLAEPFAAIAKAQPTSARLTFDPNAEFWSRTSKEYMLNAVMECGDSALHSVVRNVSLKKADLANMCERFFCNPGKETHYPTVVKNAAKFLAWLPEGMRD